MNNESKEASRSWFCVLNNPQNQFGNVEPSDMVQIAIDLWCENKPQRTCAINYEIGDNGTPHMHMVLEDPAKSRFTAVKKLFPGIHIERTRGNKAQAEDYILKRGRFEEKKHTVIIPAVFHGVIKASQGMRNDLEIIADLIDQGLTPNEIMRTNINFRKHDSLIRRAYFDKREQETPHCRQVKVFWHVGESGSGKSYTSQQLIEKHGAEQIYFMNDYENGGFDNYCGEPILFMDEFKGGMKFQTLLGLLDQYKIQVHCRYANCIALWTEVHITSIYPPEEAYRFMVSSENQARDSVSQLLRRLTAVIFHYKDQNGYHTYEQPACEYESYTQLIQRAHSADGFIPVHGQTPFDPAVSS